MSSSPSPPASASASAPSAQYCTTHFVTGVYAPVVEFLDDRAYAKCLDTLVKACNDMLLTCEGKVFLGKRQVFPQKDWWYGCGGRMKPGESIFDASRRLFLRELKLDFNVEELKKRLQTVGHYSFLWGKREQLPQTNGTADISVVVTMELTPAERAKIVPEEFEHREWISPMEILSGDYHPALKRSMQDYIKLQRFKELDALILGDVRTNLVPAHPTPDYVSSAQHPAPTDASAPLTDAEKLAKVKEYLLYHRFVSQADTQTFNAKETL